MAAPQALNFENLWKLIDRHESISVLIALKPNWWNRTSEAADRGREYYWAFTVLRSAIGTKVWIRRAESSVQGVPGLGGAFLDRVLNLQYPSEYIGCLIEEQSRCNIEHSNRFG